MTQKVIWYPNMAPYILLLHVITNEKTLKLKQIGRLPALPRFPPQKHVPTTLGGIPVDIYTLVTSTINASSNTEGTSFHMHNWNFIPILWPHLHSSGWCQHGFSIRPNVRRFLHVSFRKCNTISWQDLKSCFLPAIYRWYFSYLFKSTPHCSF